MTIDLASARSELDACPLTDRAREAVEEVLAEVEHARAEVRTWAVPLVIYAIQHHEIDPAVETPTPTPGMDCREWCASCRLLPGVPADVVAAANARIREYEELDALEPPF